MAFVIATRTRRTRPKRADDPYSELARAHPGTREFDVNFPGRTGALGDLGDTGIAFVDDNLAIAKQQAADAAIALKISAACSVVAALTSVVLLYRTWR